MNAILPSWPAPRHVRALITTRRQGASRAPYASFNLGDHVGDDPEAVRSNRKRLQEMHGLPHAPLWLQQVHGTEVVDAAATRVPVTADGSYTNKKGVVCAVLTADCLPIFLCDRDGTQVALLHGGWRGLAGGIIAAGVKKFTAAPATLLAWLGPAIGPNAFEVGDEVRAVFVANDASAETAFLKNARGRWMADIYRLARLQLEALGVTAIDGGKYCTHTESEWFYSYRRDNVTGRMASLIWLE